MENDNAQVLPWIIKRDTHEPDDADIDFLTMLLENEFR